MQTAKSTQSIAPAEVVVKTLTPSEIADVAGALASLPLLVRYGATPESLANALGEAHARGDDLTIASSEGAPVGLAWVVSSGAFGRAAYLRLLAVCESAQGTGLGQRLLKLAEERAIVRSSHLLLLASDFNVAAHAFYRRLGYEQVGIIPQFVLANVDEWIFSKRLRAAGAS